ncbi:hypothetical protein [Streptomyces sp. NPDC048142]|uniref:hypothetical protein n=1 Tax=Streptomyces sp. NPDC048142 TaxID=3365501 RepID=UPI0037134BEE
MDTLQPPDFEVDEHTPAKQNVAAKATREDPVEEASLIFDDKPPRGARPLTSGGDVGNDRTGADAAPAANSQSEPSVHGGPCHSYPSAPASGEPGSRFNPVVGER